MSFVLRLRFEDVGVTPLVRPNREVIERARLGAQLWDLPILGQRQRLTTTARSIASRLGKSASLQFPISLRLHATLNTPRKPTTMRKP